ncbi:phage XkdN-like protein [Andreesenia angusta]|uniref:Phage XkdN-like protein n=1 Tax=Andreesenia angusta TaxID=39480 RepID=A0A1S1V6C1_9FIRM|nr:hypothetical protein [Andreesenia angusta]OHW62168.1 phage XkdN-like protein [Andreesenia angusta]
MDKNLQTELNKRSVLSAKDLIAKKGLIEKKKTKNISIEVSELGVMIFKTPTTEDLMDANEYSGRAQDFLVFNCSVEPNLRNQELQEAFGVATPIEIVRELLLPGEIHNIAELLSSSAGFNDESAKLVNDIKN